MPEKGWFWYIPQHNDMVSVGVVAEGKYLTRGGVKSPEDIFKREIEQNQWIKQHLAQGRQQGKYFLTSEYTHHAKHCGTDGLLLVGDAFAFLDPVFSSGVMLALKSGVLAADAVEVALAEQDFSPERFADYAVFMRAGRGKHAQAGVRVLQPRLLLQEADRKISRTPQGLITDCLSGDVNKDFSDLWKWTGEFVPLPEDLPLGAPLSSSPQMAAP